MKKKEETLCTFKQKGTRLQLIKLINYDINKPKEYIPGVPVYKYQVRLNRKIVHSSISEYNERKVFATYCQNIVLQLKIY